MGWSFSLVRVGGIDLRVHLTFFLLLVWFGFVFYRQAGAAGAVAGLTYILGLFGSVILHEFGHALAAGRYGIRTPTITLLPIGGVARLERIPERPEQELVVAAAGPAVNLVLAAALGITASALGEPLTGGVGLLSGGLIGRWFWAQLILVGFNVLPAFPMDGGRILRALLAMRMPYPNATQTAASIGQGMAFFFGFIGLLYNPLLIFVAFFIYQGAAAEAAVVQLRDATDGIPVAAAMQTELEVMEPSTPLRTAAERMLRSPQRAFPVIAAGGQLVGVLTREDLIKGLTQSADADVAQFMQPEPATVRADAMLGEALMGMQARGCPAVAVIGRDGRLVGMLTCENVGELVMLHSVLRRGEQPSWRRPYVEGMATG